MANRLAHESSPYLLQHAHNPVDWYPWGPEALERARVEDRPIFLSIGYSACHWCHVMERESFEDPDTAAAMNAGFVNVKVDREERPDLDSIYMGAVQALTGQGGWPLSVFLTPGGEPFFGGTYFPPHARHGMPSFGQVLAAVGAAYRERRDDVRRTAADLRELLAGKGGRTGAGSPAPVLLEQAGRALSARFDPAHGGFGTAPKFPQPVVLELLLRMGAAGLAGGSRQARASLDMATHTLRSMARGGLRDHLAGGFHRYSVDARWLVPHFEKMLYDNALLARAYLNAHQLTGAPDLRAVAEETLDYVLADLRSSEGGFYAARDADSEGEEGTFYLWTPVQVEAALSGDEARLFKRCYDVSQAGNFEGRNILHLPHDLDAVARSEGLTRQELDAVLGRLRTTLRDVRARREPPLRDEKILAGWNGMTLRALAEAGGALDRSDYTEAARGGMDFLLTALRADGRLFRAYKDGRARVNGFLEDYGAVGNGLLTLYESTLEPRWLDEAAWACEAVLEHFWEAGEERFYDTPADGEALVVRPRDVMDNATPSGTSLAVELLLRGGHLFGKDTYRNVAEAALAGESERLERYPMGFGRLLSALHRAGAEPLEVAIVGHRSDGHTQALVREALAPFHANRTVAGREPDAVLAHDLPVLVGRKAEEGRPTAWVCRAYACRAPVTSPEELRREMSGG